MNNFIFLIFILSALSFSFLKIEYPLVVFFISALFLCFKNFLHYKNWKLATFKNISPLLFTITILCLSAILSLFFCFDAWKTFVALYSFLLVPITVMLLSYYLFSNFNLSVSRNVYIFLGAFLFLHVATTLFQWLLFKNPRSVGLGIDQTPIIPYSIFLILATIYALCLIHYTKYKKISFLFLCLSITSLYANGSRSSIVAIIALLFFYLFFLLKNSRKMSFLIILILCISIASIFNIKNQFGRRFDFSSMLVNITTVLSGYPSEMGRYDPACFVEHQQYLCAPESLKNQASIFLDSSFLNRLSLYKSAFLIIKTNPWKPNGFNQHYFKYNIPENTNPLFIPYPRDKDNLSYYGEVHNSFLSAFFELGLIGGISNILFFLYLFVFGIRQKPSFYSTLLSMYVLSICIIALFDIPLGSGTTACFSFFIFGMCMGICSKKDKH